MEKMTVRLISAIQTPDGRISARARVDSVKQCAGRPELTMSVTLNLPVDHESSSPRPLPERAYDAVLAYLDIA